jgi:hypothetical protein
MTVIAKALLVAVLICAFHVLSPSPVTASHVAAEKPQISIKKKYVVISVHVVAGLKPFAGLLASCLDEGEAWSNKTYLDAQAEWRDNPKSFRGLQWTYERYYFLRSVTGRYVSDAATSGLTAARIRTSR